LKKFAVIVAAGSGSRMSSTVPKQFLMVNGKSVLWHTLNTFLHSYFDMEVILVLHEDHIETGRALVESLDVRHHISITAGGATRFQSVKNGLQFVEDPAVVFVHDGVRCLVTENLIHRCYDQTIKKGNAVPAIKPVDSLRIGTRERNAMLDRNSVYIVQTPQTFASAILKTAYEQSYDEAFTDEASVAEKIGVRINLIEGEQNNFKITQPIDLIIAEKILSSNATKGN
jgi:2-C-methyl-D-erythritol 4-phosphate cytidylyltransferase